MRISIAVHNFSLGHALWPYPVNQYSSSVRVSTGKEGAFHFLNSGTEVLNEKRRARKQTYLERIEIFYIEVT